MDKLKFCKICLARDVRVFATQDRLDKYLKELLGQKVLYSSDVPPYICYECAWLLEKCVRFKEKCLLGQNLLFEILQDKNEITIDDILSVDRIKQNLVSSLMVSPITEDCYFEFEYKKDDFDEMDDRFDADAEPLQPFIKVEEVAHLDDDNFQNPQGQDDIEMLVKCVICHRDMSHLNICGIKKQEFKVLKSISLIKKDGLFSLMNSSDEVKIHAKCKKKYCQSDQILETSSAKDNIKSLRSSTLKKKENELQCSTSEIDIDSTVEPMDCEYSEMDTNEIHPETKSNDITKQNKMEFCVICHEKLTDESKVVTVKELETFKKFSMLRKDGLYNFFNSVDEVNVHDKCQDAYTTDGNYLKLIFSDENSPSSENDDEFNEEDQKCLICRGTRNDVFEVFKVVAIERFKKFSLLRNDGLFYFFNCIDELSVHHGCRKNYSRINPKGIYNPLKLIPISCKPKPNPESRKTKKKKKYHYRIGYGPIKEFPITGFVDYDLFCFICTRKLRPENEKKMSLSKQRVIHTITDPKSKEEIIRCFQKLTTCPEYSEYKNVNETIERINKLDLVSLGAKCHMNCYNDILNPRTNRKVGHSHCNEAMDNIFKYIEEVGEDSEFTLSELSSVLTGDYVPGNRTIKANLKRRYKDRVTFIVVHHDTVVIFKN